MESTAAAPPSSPPGHRRIARVWILQPEIQHYRLAVWDELIRLGAADGTYSLTVLGTLSPDGEAFGGGRRPYLAECPLERVRRFGVRLSRWPRIRALLCRDRPELLIMEGNPRNTDCWRIPHLCHAMGIPVIAWSKVHSTSSLAPLMGLLKPRFYSRFDAAICYGESSRDELAAHGFPASRIYVANNTIDTRRVFSDTARIGARGHEVRRAAGLEGRRILLCIGRMDREKRHGDLLEAWPRLRDLDPELSLVLVAGGPLLETIRNQAAAVDRERIVVTGRVPEGDDYAWVSVCDVGIYPGAVGLAVNISLAFGKPTIIADEHGSDAEILRHGVTGWRYRRGDVDALVAAVRHVLENRREAAAVAERARALMRDSVTIGHMAASIDNAIRTALASAGAARA